MKEEQKKDDSKTPPATTDAKNTPMRTLTLRLTGRICLVEHVVSSPDGNATSSYTVLFLNARHNPSLGVPEHKPLLCGPFERVRAYSSHREDAAFTAPSGLEYGLWSVRGFDLKFDFGHKSPGPTTADVTRLADLNQIYREIDPEAEWNSPYDLLRRSDPRMFGVDARLSLAGFETITTTHPPPDDPINLRFHPGGWDQSVQVIVECTATFPSDQPGPNLIGASFDGCTRPRFEIIEEADIELAMSNLCHCAALREPHPTYAQVTGDVSRTDLQALVLDDEEFSVNYELLKTPPSQGRRPVPFRREGSGGKVPECYRPSRLLLKSDA